MQSSYLADLAAWHKRASPLCSRMDLISRAPFAGLAGEHAIDSRITLGIETPARTAEPFHPVIGPSFFRVVWA
jgi:hypothetical protein